MKVFSKWAWRNSLRVFEDIDFPQWANDAHGMERRLFIIAYGHMCIQDESCFVNPQDLEVKQWIA